MDDFELIFGFFGVLIAFAFAELLGGFVFAVRHHVMDRAGAPAIALAVLVLVDLVTFWTQLWTLRAFIPPAYGSLLVATLTCSLMFLAAKIVLPQEQSDTPLEEHFQNVRRTVVLAVMTANVPSLSFFIAIAPYREFRLIESAIWAGLYLVIAITKRQRLLWMAISLLGILYFQAAYLSLLKPDLSAPHAS